MLHPRQLLPARAEHRSLAAVEYLCGFGTGDIRDKDEAQIFSLMPGLDFDLRRLAERINLYPPGLLQLRIEPFVNFLAAPESDLEAGVSFLLKIGFVPEDHRFQPYFLLGPGLIYMTLQTREQDTQFNFIECGALGAHYFIDNHWALTAEYRYRHLSNAGLRTPNKGIDTTFILAGLTYRF